MSDYRTTRPHRDILEELRQEGKFAEVLMLAWGIVETALDGAILYEYGVSSQDPKSKPLLEMSVNRKLSLQKESRIITAEEYQTVNEFRRRRNSLFHGGVVFVPNIPEEKREELMDLAMRAADVMHELGERALRVRLGSDTG